MALNYPPIMESSRNPSLRNSVVCFWVDKRNFLPISESFSECDEMSMNKVESGLLHCSADNSMKMLYTLQKLTHETYLGKPCDAPFDETRPDELLQPHCHKDFETSCFVDSIEQYVEYVRSVNSSILGYRFWYLIQDNSFSYDRAMENWFKLVDDAKKAKQAKKKKKIELSDILPPHLKADLAHTQECKRGRFDIQLPPSRPKVFECFQTKKSYLDDGISPYLSEVLCDVSQKNQALFLSLEDENNPGHMMSTLTFNWTKSVIADTCPDVDPIYLDSNNYFRYSAGEARIPVAQPQPRPEIRGDDVDMDVEEDEEDGEDGEDGEDDLFLQEDEEENDLVHANADANVPEMPRPPIANVIAFPRGAYYVDHAVRDPGVFFVAKILTPPMDPGNISLIQQRRKQRMGISMAGENHITGDIFKQTEKIIKQRIRGMTAEELNAFALSEEFQDTFESVCQRDLKNPGAMSLSEWYSENVRKDARWSAIECQKNWPDNTLSDFGNRIAKGMFALEAVCSISYLHSEIFMTMLITMGAGDVVAEKLRFNLLLYGPPGSGKSHVLDVHKRLLIEKFCNEISYQTRKANTTEKCYNGLQNLLDELGDTFTGEGDGSGYGETKQMLSKGVLRSQHAAIVDNKRTMIETVTEIKLQWFGCTNLWLSAIQESIRDRFAVIYVPKVTRKDMDPIVESERSKNDSVREGMYDNLKKSWTKRTFIASRYWILNGLGMMPNVDTSFVTELACSIFDNMQEEFGIEIVPRERERIFMATSYICIFDAIEEVFGTDKYFAAGTPYSNIQLFAMKPFLTATREHFYYALSQFHQIIIDPTLPFVAKAMLEIIKENTGDERFACGEKKDTINRSYYLIRVGNLGINTNVCDVIAQKIMIRVKALFGIGLNIHVLKDLLKWMTVQNKNARQVRPKDDGGDYDDVIEPVYTGVAKVMSVGNVRTGFIRATGFEICCEFLHDLVKVEKPLILRAIEKSIDSYCTQERFISGINYRNGYPGAPPERIFPQLLHVIENPHNENKTLRIRRTDERCFGFDCLILDSDVDMKNNDYNEQSYYANMEEDVDLKYKRLWETKVGSPIVREAWVETRKYKLSYPEQIVVGELHKHGEVLDRVHHPVTGNPSGRQASPIPAMVNHIDQNDPDDVYMD